MRRVPSNKTNKQTNLVKTAGSGTVWAGDAWGEMDRQMWRGWREMRREHDGCVTSGEMDCDGGVSWGCGTI